MGSTINGMDSVTGTEQVREICSQKDSLLRKYQFAVGDHNRAMKVLEAKKGVLKKSDYVSIRGAADHYRSLSEQARDELDRHIGEHGC